jgi:hypothetical protein
MAKERLRAMSKFVQSAGNYAELSIARRVSREVSRQVNGCKNSKLPTRTNIHFVLRFRATKNTTGDALNAVTCSRRDAAASRAVNGVRIVPDASYAATPNASIASAQV